MNDTQTPRCDSMQSGGYDLAYFARSLERELAASASDNARLREALSACEAAINMGLTLPNGELKPYATAWAGLLADTRATLAQVQS